MDSWCSRHGPSRCQIVYDLESPDTRYVTDNLHYVRNGQMRVGGRGAPSRKSCPWSSRDQLALAIADSATVSRAVTQGFQQRALLGVTLGQLDECLQDAMEQGVAR